MNVEGCVPQVSGVQQESLGGSQADRSPNWNGSIGPHPEKVIPPRFCTLGCGTRIVSDSDLLSLPFVFFPVDNQLRRWGDRSRENQRCAPGRCRKPIGKPA